MSNEDKVSQIMHEIGPKMGLAGVTELDAMREWDLALAPDFSIRAIYDGEADHVTFYSHVGADGHELPSDLLVTLLQYNMASEETGGARLAMDENKAVHLIFGLTAVGISLDAVKTTVLSLADMSNAWQEMILQSVMTSVKQNAATAQPASDSDFIIRA